MDFELSLLIIQTITGIISLYLGYKAIKLNNEVSKIQITITLIMVYIIKLITK